MGKMTTFILIMAGLLLLFHLGGLIEQGTTPNSILLTWLINPENIGQSTLFSTIIATISAVGIAGAIVASIFQRNFELAAVSTMAVFLLNSFIDFIMIYQRVAAENKIIAILIFAPFMVLFFVSIVDWWRGRD